MEFSQLLGKILSVYLLVTSLSIMFYSKYMVTVLKKMVTENGTMMIGGVVALLFGTVIVFTHPVWEGDWRVIITVIGWLGIFKGVMIFLMPMHAKKWAMFFDSHTKLMSAGFILFLLGLYLAVNAFSQVI